MQRTVTVTIAGVALSLLLAACGGGNSGSETRGGMSGLELEGYEDAREWITANGAVSSEDDCINQIHVARSQAYDGTGPEANLDSGESFDWELGWNNACTQAGAAGAFGY